MLKQKDCKKETKMKDNSNLKMFIIYLYLSVILVFTVFNYFTPIRYEPMTSYDSLIEKHNVSGVTIPGCAYIVDIRGRNFEQINSTDYHEACHILVREDYYHFCEVYY